MKSKKNFFALAFLLVSILIISIVNLFSIRENQETIVETRKSLSNTITFIDAIIEQQKMMGQLDSVQQTAQGNKAPHFSLKDQDGKITSLESLGEKKKLLIFSSATCSTCKEFYPELDNFMKKNKKDDINIAVLQLDATEQENKTTIEKNNYSFSFLTANDNVFNNYKVVSTPTGILLDGTNTILATKDLFTYNDIVDLLKAYN